MKTLNDLKATLYKESDISEVTDKSIQHNWFNIQDTN